MTSSIEVISAEPAFKVKRLDPETALDVLNSWLRQASLQESKSYNITNDDQRYELVRRILAKEITIKEVSFL